MATPASLQGRLKVPAMAAPMLLTSGQDLERGTCLNAVVDNLPALNQCSTEDFVEWLDKIKGFPIGKDSPPCGVSLILLHSKPHSEKAIEITKSALQIASSEGYLKRIVDEGQEASTLVMLFFQSPKDNNSPTDSPRVGYIWSLLDACDPEIQEHPVPPKQGSTLLDPLTRKETRVLQLLCEGDTNSAMAEKLFVSDSTVRTHLRNINSKLNANNRTQAVAIARRLGIV